MNIVEELNILFKYDDIFTQYIQKGWSLRAAAFSPGLLDDTFKQNLERRFEQILKEELEKLPIQTQTELHQRLQNHVSSLSIGHPQYNSFLMPAFYSSLPVHLFYPQCQLFGNQCPHRAAYRLILSDYCKLYQCATSNNEGLQQPITVLLCESHWEMIRVCHGWTILLSLLKCSLAELPLVYDQPPFHFDHGSFHVDAHLNSEEFVMMMKETIDLYSLPFNPAIPCFENNVLDPNHKLTDLHPNGYFLARSYYCTGQWLKREIYTFLDSHLYRQRYSGYIIDGIHLHIEKLSVQILNSI
jgi:hypothetical protein